VLDELGPAGRSRSREVDRRRVGIRLVVHAVIGQVVESEIAGRSSENVCSPCTPRAKHHDVVQIGNALAIHAGQYAGEVDAPEVRLKKQPRGPRFL
jgi:hypothetical protein